MYRVQGKKLTGLNKLKDKYSSETAIICCSGTTMEDYDDSIPPREWKRIAVNEAIKGLGESADFWVLSDREIVLQYAKYCPKNTTVLAMNDAVSVIEKHCRDQTVYTVESMAKPKDYTNGYEFFSRGTVAIGAVEMARWMGISRMFFFGLDCYRKKDQYYYDGRRPQFASEHLLIDKERIRGTPPKVVIYCTARLKRMVEKLNLARESGLWDKLELWCVNSPYSQQKAIKKMTIEEFKKEVEIESSRRRKRGRPKKSLSESEVPEENFEVNEAEEDT